MTLSDFLLARIAEDEANARSEDLRDQCHRTNCGYWMWEDEAACECGVPARVLAECEAKRRIVELREHLDQEIRRLALSDHERATDMRATRLGLDMAIQLHAAAFADHHDYDEAWRP